MTCHQHVPREMWKSSLAFDIFPRATEYNTKKKRKKKYLDYVTNQKVSLYYCYEESVISSKKKKKRKQKQKKKRAKGQKFSLQKKNKGKKMRESKRKFLYVNISCNKCIVNVYKHRRDEISYSVWR